MVAIIVMVVVIAVVIVIAYIIFRRWETPQLIGASAIPHRIWIYWSQGWDMAPDLCKLCMTSWRTLHPSWDVVTLSWETLPTYLDTTTIERIATCPTHQAKSDYIRAALLRYHGGVWVDATLYCAKPLETWLPELHGGIFMFSFPYPRLVEQMTLISSWFIAAAQPENYMMTRLYDEVVRYWSAPPSQPYYFWFHKLFDKLYDTDPIFKRRWQRITPMNTIHPLLVGLAPTSLAMAEIKARRTPVFKLNHRKRLDASVLRLLITQP